MVNAGSRFQSTIRSQYNDGISPLPLLFDAALGILAKYPDSDPCSCRRKLQRPSAGYCSRNAASEPTGATPEGARRRTHADADAVGPGRSRRALLDGGIGGTAPGVAATRQVLQRRPARTEKGCLVRQAVKLQ